MARQSKKKKTVLQGIIETIHSLTKPKRIAKKAIPRKKSASNHNESSIKSKQKIQENLEEKITKKISDDMQVLKQQIQQELMEKLTKHQAVTNNVDKNSVKRKKKAIGVKKQVISKLQNKSNKGSYKPQTNCTFLNLLVLSDNVEREVVVGYELLDNSSQEIWGVNIHEGTRLGRSKHILNTRVKSRKIESGREYYLVNETDVDLYFSEKHKKPILMNGRVSIANYTNGLANAIEEAYTSGYRSNSKLPKLRKN